MCIEFNVKERESHLDKVQPAGGTAGNEARRPEA